MNLLPIIEHLESEGLGVQAKTLFINQMPAEAPTGILLRNTLQGTHIDYELPGYFKGKFQLIIRANSYSVGDELITSAIAALTLSNVTLGDMTFKYMRPQTLPVVFPISKGNLLEFATVIDAVFTI